MAFRILALSGGGYLGLFSLRVLRLMEEAAGRPISQSFDLMCGTSAGAITTLALSLEVPAAEIEDAFVRHGPKIFQQPDGRFREVKRTWAFMRSLIRPKYTDVNLRRAIASIIPEGSVLADARHRLVLPLVNMTTGALEVFKTPHLAQAAHNRNVSMIDLAVAATAAPTYFPLAELRNSLYVDGAIFANAPDLVGLHEAQYYLKQPSDQIELLSIGTTTASFSLPHGLGRNYGAVRWLRGGQLYATILSAQQQLTHVFMRHHLGARYVRIDSTRAPGQQADLAFDSATQAGTKTLFSLADHAFEEACKTPLMMEITKGTTSPPKFFDAAGGVISSQP
ncbi:MAG TPA: CBASS cGAMP-activated phospholipase [Hyphomicrobiaceae bacterium]|jgi:hypothetical protein|nr:CBASS cGAMP-activated phospholipase [Hyphomicrobiaceae bacterium]